MANTQMERCPRCKSRRKEFRKYEIGCPDPWHSIPAAPETAPDYSISHGAPPSCTPLPGAEKTVWTTSVSRMREDEILAFVWLNAHIKLSRPQSVVRRFSLKQRKAIAIYLATFAEYEKRRAASPPVAGTSAKD